MSKREPWIYDERTGMVAVYAGEQLNCLDLPSDSFIYVRGWKRKTEGLGFEVIEEDKRIGKLVAAAPDLLEALKENIARHVDRCGCTDPGETQCPGIEGALAAIAKAEGPDHQSGKK